MFSLYRLENFYRVDYNARALKQKAPRPCEAEMYLSDGLALKLYVEQNLKVSTVAWRGRLRRLFC